MNRQSPPQASLCWVAAISLIMIFASCDTVDYSGLVYHSISPQDCDPSLADSGANHLAGFNPGTGDADTLLVFLPGTAGAPASHSLFLKQSALKFHTLALEYPCDISIGSLCGDNLDAYGPVRQEICTGSDSSALVSVDQANSITGRLVSALTYLEANYPDEGWGVFLSGGEPVWSKLILSGYSQGAGHAAWLSSQHEAKGVLLFSGVVDASTSGSPRTSASWISNAAAPLAGSFGQTPLSQFRFFIHTADGFLPGIQANLVTMGRSWDSWSISIDPGEYYGSSKPVFSTSWLFLDSSKAHPSTCEDGATPLYLNGVPVFRDVWDELLSAFD